MRGFHDEMGGPDSVASPSEWGPLGWGDGVTAAGLPASPGAPSAPPSEDVRRRVLFERGMRFLREQPSEKINGNAHDAMRRGWLIPSASTSPSDEQLRHNHLLRRHIFDPGYGGASRELSWREKAANGLGVPYVAEVTDEYVAALRRVESLPSPSE